MEDTKDGIWEEGEGGEWEGGSVKFDRFVFVVHYFDHSTEFSAFEVITGIA